VTIPVTINVLRDVTTHKLVPSVREKLQIPTVKCAAELKKWSAQGKCDRSLFVTSNQCIPLKNTFGLSAVVFCACEIIQLFSAVLYMVRTVRKFEFGFVMGERG
jgi:hypothetical protein